MNAEGLLEHYERMVDAPDAIVKLRSFVLDLAVRGKLVAQNSKDEPAAKLIERILADKSRVAKLGKGKIERSPDLDCEPAFNIPNSWEWVPATFPAIVSGDMGKKVQTKSVLEDGKFPVVDQGKVFIRGYCNDESKVTRVDGPLILFGDHTREIKLIDFDFVVGDDGVKLLKPVCIHTRYYFMALQWLPLDSRGYGRHFKLLQASAITLPPLPEQHRIVAKVDELMALCDQLEAARAHREATRDRLAAASLARLNAPDPDTFPADARFALDALPALTTRPDQIKQLRQTILCLAVRGKLVPQATHEGTGDRLISELAEARCSTGLPERKTARRVSQGAIGDDEKYLDAPSSWDWTRLVELGQTQTGTSPSSSDPSLFGSYIPFVKPSDLDGREICYEGPGLSQRGVERSRLADTGSVLMVCIGATLGKVNTTTRPICFNQQINSVTPYIEGMSGYVALALKAAGFQALAWSKAGTGTLPIISKGKWELLPIPVPPLAEQHRIVAKVDELMELCDQLEASLTAGETTRRRLLDALLHEALAA